MDKKLFRKWFNGKYGKLSPERQLQEISKLRIILDEFEESRLRKFNRYHVKCDYCGKYSLRTTYGKCVEPLNREMTVNGEKKIGKFSVEFYSCPKCKCTFVFEQYFLGYEGDEK